MSIYKFECNSINAKIKRLGQLKNFKDLYLNHNYSN